MRNIHRGEERATLHQTLVAIEATCAHEPAAVCVFVCVCVCVCVHAQERRVQSSHLSGVGTSSECAGPSQQLQNIAAVILVSRMPSQEEHACWPCV